METYEFVEHQRRINLALRGASELIEDVNESAFPWRMTLAKNVAEVVHLYDDAVTALDKLRERIKVLETQLDEKPIF